MTGQDTEEGFSLTLYEGEYVSENNVYSGFWCAIRALVPLTTKIISEHRTT